MSNARNRRRTSIRRAHGERAIRKDYEPDAIVIWSNNLGEPLGHVRIETETIELSGTHPAQAACVQCNEHVEVLILGELARDVLTCASSGLPVDSRDRI